MRKDSNLDRLIKRQLLLRLIRYDDVRSGLPPLLGLSVAALALNLGDHSKSLVDSQRLSSTKDGARLDMYQVGD